MLQLATDNIHIPIENKIIKWVKSIFQTIDIKDNNNIIIRVVDIEEARALNLQFRQQDKATNVLSFPSELPDDIDEPYLGDIVICADIVEAEALAQNKSIEAHWAHMVTHGILHLVGHDHLEDAQASVMESMEIKIMSALGYPDPYAS